MVGFLFELVIALLVLGLLFYLVRWAVGALGLPQPIVSQLIGGADHVMLTIALTTQRVF